MSAVAAYHIFVCTLFLVQGGMWIVSTYLPAQRTNQYMIFCHNTHNNGIFLILTRDFS